MFVVLLVGVQEFRVPVISGILGASSPAKFF